MTPDYPALKAVHVTCVAVSYLLFVTRGIWMVRDSRMLERRWVRIVPHLNDTILLASAIALVWTIRQYPFVAGWLTAKVVALLAYVALGMIALRYGRDEGYSCRGVDRGASRFLLHRCRGAYARSASRLLIREGSRGVILDAAGTPLPR